MIGKTISHYRIVEQLGAGGMGIVYKAQDLKLDRFVALKFLPPHLTTSDEEKQRFIHEAKAASALQHNNICAIHEIDETEDGQIFICMDYYEGETLDKKIKEKPLPIDEANDISIQIAQGLAKAHEKDIVHRDIKPANIMLTSDGVVKILDFGLAKLSTQTKLTKESTTLGTVSYMSPEQAKGEEVDYRTDIWSLGVILYEMLTGQLPFKGEYESAVIYSILNDTQEPVTGLRTGVPTELEPFINKCLNKNPSDRYQHVDELIVDLTTLEKKSEPVDISIKEKRRTKTVILPVAVLLIIMMIVVDYYLFKPDQKSTSGWVNSIAVLPFDNISNDSEQEYFCDGITEDIIAHLSKIGNFKVISRTSIMQYKNVEKTLPEIAEELNVKMILEGTVRRVDDRVRIVAQLIEAREDNNIWTETYDRELKDIFAIQSDVAERIAGVLKVELSPKEKSLIQKKPTENLAAYNFYIKGREYYYRYQKADNEQAIRMFKKALEIDPSYALAYAGLGDAYSMGYHRFGFSAVWIDSALKVSKKAIEIDPNSAEAYKALGVSYAVIDRSSLAIDANKKAIQLNPGYYPAMANLGYRYLKDGHLGEALKWFKKTRNLNPAFSGSYNKIGLVYNILCEDLKAQHAFEKALEFDPQYVFSHWALISLYLVQNKYDKALAQVDEILKLTSDSLNAFTYAGYVEHIQNNLSKVYNYFDKAIKISQTKYFYNFHIIPLVHLGTIQWKKGEREKAKNIFSDFLTYAEKEIEAGNESWEIRYNIAGIYSVMGEQDKALLWIDRAIDAGWRDYRIGKIEPLFEKLRQDNRFKKRIERVKGLVDKTREQIKAAQY
jgi:serine/threonine protein kinase/lipoprotein NlpI